LTVIGDLQGGFFRIMDVPEDDRVHVDGNGVLGQRLLGVECGGLNALVDDGGHIVEHGNNREEARPFHALQLARSQDDEFLPGVRHLQRQGDADGNDNKRRRQIEIGPLTEGDAHESAGDREEKRDRIHVRYCESDRALTTGSETTQETAGKLCPAMGLFGERADVPAAAAENQNQQEAAVPFCRG
jgi:hypothetical protein